MMILVSLTLVELNRFSSLLPRFSRIINALVIEDKSAHYAKTFDRSHDQEDEHICY